jgi:hypothetical protein
MSFPMAEAYTRIFPELVRLVLPQGVIDIEHNNPPGLGQTAHAFVGVSSKRSAMLTLPQQRN